MVFVYLALQSRNHFEIYLLHVKERWSWFQRSILYRPVGEFNSLPNEIKTSRILNVFKSKLKNHYYSAYYVIYPFHINYIIKLCCPSAFSPFILVINTYLVSSVYYVYLNHKYMRFLFADYLIFIRFDPHENVKKM